MPSRRTLTPLLAAAGLVVTWSSGFIGAELGTRAATTETLLAWRFGLAGVLAAAWLAWHLRRLDRRDLAVGAVIGLLTQAGYVYGVVRAAELGVSAGTSALIAALQPIVATLAAAAVLSENTTWRTWAGLVLGLGGTGLVVASDGAAAGAPAWAYAVPVAAMLSLVAGTLLERRTYRHRPAPRLTDALAVQFVASGLAFTALAAAGGDLAPPARIDFWVAVAWVIVLSSFAAYGCYWAVAQAGGVSRVSALLYLTPAATALWAWAMFGQAMTALSIAGMAVSAGAVALIVAPARRPARGGGAPAETRPVPVAVAEAGARRDGVVVAEAGCTS